MNLYLYFFQITHAVTQKIKVNISSGEDHIQLIWEETKVGVNYSLGYGIQGNLTYQDVDYSISPDNTATYLLDKLSPGVTYLLELFKDGQQVFTSTKTTSKYWSIYDNINC